MAVSIILMTEIMFHSFKYFAVSSEVILIQASSPDNDTVLVISWELPTNPNGDILTYSVSIINLKNGSTVRQDAVKATNITQTNLGI